MLFKRTITTSMHIDMRQIRELLKEDYVESMLQADQGESEEMTQTSF